MYWNKDRRYRDVKYMNLLFILFVAVGLLETIKKGNGWFSFVFMILILIGFNVERYLHYKAYGKEVLEDYYDDQRRNGFS